MLKVIRWLAVISLTLAVLFDIAVYYGLFGSLTGNTYTLMDVFHFAYNTTLHLCFVTGVLALVPAAQRRQRVWFAVILVWLIIANYSPLAMQAYWDAQTATFQPGSLPSPALNVAAILYPFAAYLFPEVPALIALLYTLLTRPGHAVLLPSDDSLEIERTPIHASGQH